MKIHLGNESSQSIGGGWTFLSNLRRSLDAEFVDNWQECDVFFISGATMVTRKLVEQVKSKGKKIVLRIDNIPRNSRNRNTGTSRLFDMAQMADLVIYQSSWCKEYIEPFVRRDGPVIINGCDQSIFKPEGEKTKRDTSTVYMYSRYNRDETKNWEHAWYYYQMLHQENKDSSLWIVGNFSPEQIQYNFDFYRGEKYKYFGVVEDQQVMANIYRGADYFLYTYFCDACSNTLIEAISCGVEPLYYQITGGAIDIKEKHESEGIEYFSLDRMAGEYKKEIEGIL